jgi:hypothetical protein
LSLDELRRRMPELRQREHALQTELNSILDQISDRTRIDAMLGDIC